MDDEHERALADLASALPVESLVPGDPDSVTGVVTSMSSYADVLAAFARDLDAVDVAWIGPSADAFADRLTRHAATYRAVAAALDTAATVLSSYVVALLTARCNADHAVAVFQRGVRAAAEARTSRSTATGLRTSGPLDLRGEPGGLVERTEGTDLLVRARTALDAAGDDAALRLTDAMAGAPEVPSWWQQAGSVVLGTLDPFHDSPELDSFRFGGLRGTLDLAWQTALPAGVGFVLTDPAGGVLDDLEDQLGVPRSSSWYTAGSVVVPSVVTGGAGGEAAAARLLSRTATRGLAYSEYATAEAAADAALAGGRTTGAAAQLTVGDRTFVGLSTGGTVRGLNPEVERLLDDVPPARQARWHGECGEMACVSRALQEGVDPRGGSIRAVAIGESRPAHGLPKKVCRSCQHVLDAMGVLHDLG